MNQQTHEQFLDIIQGFDGYSIQDDDLDPSLFAVGGELSYLFTNAATSTLN